MLSQAVVCNIVAPDSFAPATEPHLMYDRLILFEETQTGKYRITVQYLASGGATTAGRENNLYFATNWAMVAAAAPSWRPDWSDMHEESHLSDVGDWEFWME